MEVIDVKDLPTRILVLRGRCAGCYYVNTCLVDEEEGFYCHEFLTALLEDRLFFRVRAPRNEL